MIWLTVLVVAALNTAIKGLGPALLGGRPLPPRATAVVALLAPALLTALILTQTVVDDGRFVIDARLAGVAAATAAVLARVPMVAAIVLGAAVAALLRAI